MRKFTTYEAAKAANPNHPVITHAEYCLNLAAYPRNVDRIKTKAINYFNK